MNKKLQNGIKYYYLLSAIKKIGKRYSKCKLVALAKQTGHGQLGQARGLVYPAAGASRVLIKTFLRLGLHVFLIFIESTRR